MELTEKQLKGLVVSEKTKAELLDTVKEKLDYITVFDLMASFAEKIDKKKIGDTPLDRFSFMAREFCLYGYSMAIDTYTETLNAAINDLCEPQWEWQKAFYDRGGLL